MSKTSVCFCGRVFVRSSHSVGRFCSQVCFREYEQTSPTELRRVEAKYLPVKNKREYVVNESELSGHTVEYKPKLRKSTHMKLNKLIKRLRAYRLGLEYSFL